MSGHTGSSATSRPAASASPASEHPSVPPLDRQSPYEADRIRWRLASVAGEVGSFDWDLRTGRLDWDDQLLAIFGLTRASFGGSIEAFNAAVHPDDLPQVTEALQNAIAGCSEYVAEYRITRPDGAERWVHARGKALAGEDGVAARVLGAAYDTTDRREDDARIARVLETMSAAFFLLDEQWRFAYVNAEAEKLLGRTRSELVGAVIWEQFPAAVSSAFEEQYRSAAATGEPRVFEAYYPAPLDRWYEVRAWPGPDGLSVYFMDCTERRTAQEEARRAHERAEAERAAAERARQAAEADKARLQLLGDVAEDLSSTLDIEEGVGRLARHLVPALGTWCLITLSSDQRHLRDIASWHADPALRDTVARYAELRLNALAPTSYVHRALRTGKVVDVPDATNAIAQVLSGEALQVLRELAPGMAYAIPLRARGRTVGAITLFLDAERPALTRDDVVTIVQLADRAGLALDNARLYDEQRTIAESLQRALLSEPVEPDHLDVVVRYLPASRAAEVGGDWYDAFLQPQGATVFVVGDVIGHDTQAAAEMSQVRTLLRAIGYTTGAGPAQILTSLDDAMRGLRLDAMATAVVARLEQTPHEREQGLTRLRWSNAGHPPPLVSTSEHDVVLLDEEQNGPLLGLQLQAHRPEGVITLRRGSTVLLYTDGLVERRGERLSAGMERLRTVVAGLLRQTPVRGRDSLERFVDDVIRLMLDGRTDDDVALVAVHLRPG